MVYFVVFFVICILITLFCKVYFEENYSYKDMFVSWVISLIIIGICYLVSLYALTFDTQILSGEITKKYSEHVNCNHSYSCNCVTDSKGKRSCKTCYEHSYDVDWVIETNIDKSILIDRVDKQGVIEPNRYTVANIGDPISITDTYTNYIKAVPETILNNQAYLNSGVSTRKIPNYPDNIYDYYKIDRVVDLEKVLPEQDFKILNQKISESLRTLAKEKQVNIVIVVTKNTDKLYFQDLKNAWLGGKKNDIVIVVAISEYPVILWTNVFSWSKNDLINTVIRDEITDYGKLDTQVIDIITNNINKHWSRKHMSDYEYLKNEITPSTLSIIISFVVIGIILIVTVRVLQHN